MPKTRVVISPTQAELDSHQLVAADPYPPCRESIRIFLRGVAATPAMADRIKGDLCAGTPSNLRLTGALNQRVLTSLSDSPDSLAYDSRSMAAAVTAASLVIHGDADPLPLEGSKEWVQALSNARLVVIPRAGHYPHAEQPERFFSEIEAFLSAQAAP